MSQSLQLTGRLVKKNNTKQVSDTFKVREFVIRTGVDTDYPQDVKFQCVQDRTGIINGFVKDAEITVHFDIRGREHNGNVFNNLNAWKVALATDARREVIIGAGAISHSAAEVVINNPSDDEDPPF